MKNRLFNKSLPLILILAGVVLIFASIAVDLAKPGSRIVFGPLQFRLALLGFILLLVGLFVALPSGQRFLQRWRTPSAMGKQAVRPAGLLLIAVWFALLTGLAEAFIMAEKRIFFGRYIFLSPHVAWMAPVANLFIFAIPTFLLLLVIWRWPRLITFSKAATVFAFLSFVCMLFMVTWLHTYAALVLAAGLAVQGVRLIGTRFESFYSVVRRTTLWLATLTVALAAGVYGWQRLAEHRAIAALPPAGPDTPNVLLIVLDTVRAQSLSLYGHVRPTSPNLERLAETGVTFERAIATAPWTVPSHASMFTGRFPNELSVTFQKPLDSTYPTLAELFTNRGYLTAGFSANLGYCSYETGLNRGFIHYEDYRVSFDQIFASSSLYRAITNSNDHIRKVGASLSRKSAEQINSDFLRWLTPETGRPFFAFLNYFDAHAPYLPPEPIGTKSGSEQTDLDLYESCIEYLDHQIGLLFDELESRDLLRNTLVIITSDHGEQFGEHNLHEHGNSVYMPLLHVPLLILFPSRVPTGKNVREIVTLCDIPATVIDLLQLEENARFPGTSLARYWDDAYNPGNAATSRVLSEHGEIKSLVVGRYHYILKDNDLEELYDLEDDPAEERNLADTVEGRRVCERFRASLETLLASNQLSN
jgi:arylsulfatase A-like enzyme